MNIIEFFKNPKKRAIGQLVFYAIFFIIVFIILGISNSNTNYSSYQEEYNDDTLTNKDVLSYSYNITINDEIISGIYYEGVSTFTHNFNNYYLEDNILYVIDNDSYRVSNIEYDISKILNIKELINDLEEYSTTTYKDGRKVKSYIISSNDFYRFYYNEDSLEEFDIYINVEETSDIIKSIEIINIGSNINNIKIEYSDINNIESLNFNKDNYNFEE